MGSDVTLQNVGEIRARLQNGKVHKPNDAICEVTGRMIPEQYGEFGKIPVPLTRP